MSDSSDTSAIDDKKEENSSQDSNDYFSNIISFVLTVIVLYSNSF